MTESAKTNKQACNSKSEFQSLHQPIVALRPVKRPNVILITNGQCIIEHIGAKKNSHQTAVQVPASYNVQYIYESFDYDGLESST